MDLTKSSEPFTFKREVSLCLSSETFSCGLEKASYPELYSCKKVNSANNHIGLEENPHTLQMRLQAWLTSYCSHMRP